LPCSAPAYKAINYNQVTLVNSVCQTILAKVVSSFCLEDSPYVMSCTHDSVQKAGLDHSFLIEFFEVMYSC